MSPQQKSLFDTEPAPWELDAQNQLRVAKVVLPTGPTGEFDYLVPNIFSDLSKREILAEPGRRLLVPLGRGDRQVMAYCVEVGISSGGGRRLKQVLGVLDPVPLLSPHLLDLGRWIADHYLAPLGQVLEAILPAGVRSQAGTRETILLSVPTEVAASLTQLDLPAKQREALTLLAASSKPLTVKQLMNRAGCSSGPINELRKQGLITQRVERIDTDALLDEPLPRGGRHILNAEQQAALKQIEAALNSKQQTTLLLRGVTGSGKTEVYIQAIEQVVAFGRQAIVLVPEISLTPQTVGRFRERFDRVAVLHSHQSDVERHRHWRRIAAGEIEVVVGARSAIFAPTPHLGLVVIDEEHEASFKQDKVPRYHARDVALRRTQFEEVPLVLGSATPALESWHRARTGQYQLVELAQRVSNLPLPAVRAIDLREEQVRREGRGAISRPMHQAMSRALGASGQIILLLNRRGFSTQVQCPACGYVLKCHQCDVPMVYHRHTQVVICHWCDYQLPPPALCPDCRSAEIRYSGFGTQKLEAEVRARFPQATVLRMDTDSMRRPGSHETALSAFRRGEVQILLGTQMIAKGLDFPNVTLVGVVNADTSLHWPDFRAAERTFQLVTQVAGRTGRGSRGGEVLVQTLSPDHPAIVTALQHDYLRFALNELREREAHRLPPYSSLARVIIRGPVEATTLAWAESLAERLQTSAERLGLAGDRGIQLIGPAPCPLPKLRDLYRMHFLISAPDHNSLHKLLAPELKRLEVPEKLEWQIDVDPLDMM